MIGRESKLGEVKTCYSKWESINLSMEEWVRNMVGLKCTLRMCSDSRQPEDKNLFKKRGHNWTTHFVL